MFGFREKAPTPAAPETIKDLLRGKLTELLNVGESATWPELEDSYRVAKPALESNPNALLSPEDEATLHKLAQAARENARDAELRQAA